MVGAVAARTAAVTSRPNAKRQADGRTNTGCPDADWECRRTRNLLNRCFKVFIILFFVPLVRAWPPSRRRFTRNGAVYVLLAERNLFLPLFRSRKVPVRRKQLPETASAFVLNCLVRGRQRKQA